MTYSRDDGSKNFQVFINTQHPTVDPKRKLLHELTHVVDVDLANEFPDSYKDEAKESNDIKFFLSIGLLGISTIILCNWAVYSTDIIPNNLQKIIGIGISLAIGLKLENMTSYTQRPNEIRARANEKLIPGRISRAITKIMAGHLQKTP